MGPVRREVGSESNSFLGSCSPGILRSAQQALSGANDDADITDNSYRASATPARISPVLAGQP
jgi:hypothetical protein